MKARYKGTCAGCAEAIEPGDEIAPYGNGEAYHKDCEPQGGKRATKGRNDRPATGVQVEANDNDSTGELPTVV